MEASFFFWCKIHSMCPLGVFFNVNQTFISLRRSVGKKTQQKTTFKTKGHKSLKTFLDPVRPQTEWVHTGTHLQCFSVTVKWYFLKHYGYIYINAYESVRKYSNMHSQDRRMIQDVVRICLYDIWMRFCKSRYLVSICPHFFKTEKATIDNTEVVHKNHHFCSMDCQPAYLYPHKIFIRDAASAFDSVLIWKTITLCTFG